MATDETKSAPEAPPNKPAGLDLEQFAVDEAKEVGGAWFEIANGVAFLIARLNNSVYLKAMATLYSEKRVAIERSLMEDDEADDAMCGILATTIFRGFRGDLRHAGEPLSDSVESRVLIMKDYKELRRLIMEKAGEANAYRAEGVAEAGKSS